VLLDAVLGLSVFPDRSPSRGPTHTSSRAHRTPTPRLSAALTRAHFPTCTRTHTHQSFPPQPLLPAPLPRAGVKLSLGSVLLLLTLVAASGPDLLHAGGSHASPPRIRPHPSPVLAPLGPRSVALLRVSRPAGHLQMRPRRRRHAAALSRRPVWG
jgi:hypothetical protein